MLSVDVEAVLVLPARSETTPAGIEALLRTYLSVQHRDHREAGCPSAALLDEIGRCGDSTRNAYAKGASALIAQIASRLSPEDPVTARGRALSLLALMAGSLQLSRAIADPGLSDEILDQGFANALALAGIDAPVVRPRQPDV